MFLCLQVPTNQIARQVLNLCVRVCVPISLPQWELWPTCYAVIPITVFSVKRRESVCVHAVFLHWGWCSGQSVFAAVAWLRLSFRLLKYFN